MTEGETYPETTEAVCLKFTALEYSQAHNAVYNSPHTHTHKIAAFKRFCGGSVAIRV